MYASLGFAGLKIDPRNPRFARRTIRRCCRRLLALRPNLFLPYTDQLHYGEFGCLQSIWLAETCPARHVQPRERSSPGEAPLHLVSSFLPVRLLRLFFSSFSHSVVPDSVLTELIHLVCLTVGWVLIPHCFLAHWTLSANSIENWSTTHKNWTESQNSNNSTNCICKFRRNRREIDEDSSASQTVLSVRSRNEKTALSRRLMFRHPIRKRSGYERVSNAIILPPVKATTSFTAKFSLMLQK